MIEDAAIEVALQVVGIGLAVAAVAVLYLICDYRGRRRAQRASLRSRLMVAGLIETQRKP